MRTLVLILNLIVSMITFAGEGEGGVDVGNFRVTNIPGANLNLQLPKDWKTRIESGVLEIVSPGKSRITARLANFGSNQVSSRDEILRYLNDNNSREYKKIDINGMNGLKYVSDDNLIHDLYVISPTKEIVKIEAISDKNDSQMTKAILEMIFFKYRGVKITDSHDITVTLYHRLLSGVESQHNISFSNDCGGNSCSDYMNGVLGEYGNSWDSDEFQLGIAGYDTGKIIDLGLNLSDYDKINIQGEYLALPKSKVKLDRLYETFTAKGPIESLDRITLKEGHVYLIRTIRWPEEDLLVKMRVDSLDENNKAVLTFKRLAVIPQKQLQSYIDYMNHYTLDVEAKRTEGIVTLYDRVLWAGDYAPATFNFHYGTRDNQFITYNAWDLLFDGGDERRSKFSFAGSWSDRGAVIDFGKTPLNEVSLNSFPIPNSIFHDKAPVKLGHTYLVMSYLTGLGVTWSAFEVLDIEPEEGRWVKIKWKIFKKDKFDDPFVHQVVTDSFGIKSASTKLDERFYPYADFFEKDLICTTDFSISKDSIALSSNLGGGYYKFEGKLEEATLQNFKESKLIHSKHLDSWQGIYNYKLGEVYYIKLRSFWEETIFALEVKKVEGDMAFFDYRIISLEQAVPGYCGAP
ncbi:hypothetical protein HBN50_03375 [Halobacteriovorax sp. GB3]|uniref:hypothetical protein n=1 Tax=Halobacteriovorax sp. GB3 TaxID=2719615 RepID=UPI00235E8C39|nr:hypothetical protein [Halobacteriovorax sp. GB3]MDD0852118.1 hypothetical protein [Halobacteriovorax sp. GB3]